VSATLCANAPAQIDVSAAARSVQPGELVVLTIATPEPVELRIRAFDRDLVPFPVDARTWRVLIGIDLAVTAGTYPVAIEAGPAPDAVRATHDLVVTTRRFPTRTLKVDPAFVNPPASAIERIQREAEELNQLWEAGSPAKLWDGLFLRPVPDPATSAFGTRSIFNGQPRSPHSGADFQSPAGRPVKAPNAGRIVLASSRYFTGGTVMIDHGLGVFSLFAHLSAIGVSAGDLVKAGDVVGEVGATGRVTGPHLHWAVRVNGARIDPLSLLSVLGYAGR
jgi:murein DD-endopeptidase MepM/ murein hydrolase activator NlpD